MTTPTNPEGVTTPHEFAEEFMRSFWGADAGDMPETYRNIAHMIIARDAARDAQLSQAKGDVTMELLNAVGKYIAAQDHDQDKELTDKLYSEMDRLYWQYVKSIAAPQASDEVKK